MKKSAILKQERQQRIAAQKAIVEGAKNEKGETRSLTAEETVKFNAEQTEIDRLKEEIRMAEQFEENQREAAAIAGAPVEDSEEKEKKKVEARFSILKAIRTAAPGSPDALDGAEKEIHEIGLAETRAAGQEIPKNTHLSLPLSTVQRATAQTVTEDSGSYGGALVQNQAPRMVEPLRPRLMLEDLGATFLTGLSGGNIPLIVDNDFAMTFLAETTAITPQKKTYAGPTLSPKRAGGAVDLSNQLLLQSSVDVDQRVARGIVTGFKNLLHAACINGAGGVAPTGVLSTSGVLASTTVAAAAATWAMIVELSGLTEQNDGTEQSLGFLLSPKLKSALKLIKKDAGSGRFLLEGNEIDGMKYISSSLVPVLDDGGTPVYPLIFGDWAQMVIGQWGAINVTLNPYSADLSNALRLVLNTYADMQIANPKAFAKNAFLTA